MNIDPEKTFDFMNHNFLIAILKKYGFGENFKDWINIIDKSTIIRNNHSVS